MPTELSQWPGEPVSGSTGEVAGGSVVDATTGTPPQVVDPQARKVCGAKLRNGGRCPTAPMPNGRCRMHGGMTPTGMALPQTKHGRYSKYLKDLPDKLRAGYRSALADENLLSLRDDLALLETRSRELLRQMEQTPAPPWEDVRKAMGVVNVAIGSGDQEVLRQSLLAMAEVVDAGVVSARAYESCWNKLNDTIERKTKVAVAEWKRLTELNGVVKVEDAMMFLKAILMAAKEVVTDQRQLQDLQRKCLAFLPTPEDQ